MTKYKITGMTCAACSARVEKAISSVSGVDVCNVNLLTNSATVDGDFSQSDIFAAVKKAGYGISLTDEKNVNKSKTDNNLKPLILRLVFSSVFLIVLLYFSAGINIFNFPLPAKIQNNYLFIGIIQLLLTSVIMVINQRFFINGWNGIKNKSLNMDTLVSLGAGASFIYSCYSLFALSNAYFYNDFKKAEYFSKEFYFESAAMILTLISIGKLLESYSKGKTTNAIEDLKNLAPLTVNVYINGTEKQIDIKELKKDDIFIVRPGESFPADAQIIKGETAVDESAVSGESLPVDKGINDSVFCGTINISGTVECKTQKAGEESSLFKVIKMVEDAAATKAPIARIADKISGYFVPIVVLISIITFFVWMIFAKSISFSLARSVSVLVISCPCALGLATPVAVMVGSGVGAKHGILFKSAQVLENAGKINAVVFDKTGTLTFGEPQVTDVLTFNGVDKEELLKYAYSLENSSSHPLSKAVCQYAENLNIKLLKCDNFKNFPGCGIKGTVESQNITSGNYSFICKTAVLNNEIENFSLNLSLSGKTPLFFMKNDVIIGIIAVADKIRPESKKAAKMLKKEKIKTFMLTGDNKNTALSVCKEIGIDSVFSELLPANKVKKIKEIKKDNFVAMVGDGINDAPALSTADIGIAIGAGTDIAIDSADIILMKNSPYDVFFAIKLSKAVIKTIYQNLFWAFFYNIIGIPLAAGVFIPFFGLKLSPMFAAAAMSFSSICVIGNALKLNSFRIKSKGEKIKMEKTVYIEGMMCTHCSSHVKAALEKLPEIDNADVDYQNGTAIIKLNSDIFDEKIKNVIENEGYKFIKII